MRLAAAAAVLFASTFALSAPAVTGLLSRTDHAKAQSQPDTAPIRIAEAKGKEKEKAKAKEKAKEKAKAKDKAGPKKGGEPKGGNGGGGTYTTLPLAERVGIQYDLAWTGHFNGLINGDFNDRAINAAKAFQKANGFRETTLLAPPERTLLASQSKAAQERVGWKMVDDKATGAQIGLPTSQVPRMATARRGTRWSSAQGQVQIETFRIREPGTTLAAIFEQEKQEPPNRKIEVNLLRDDYFILSGMQGLKKFYVRAHIRDLEVRGMTILWDQATEGVMDPVAVVMSSAFAPFPGTGLTDLMGPTRRKIDYGTGIVVTAGGHILADSQFVDGCSVVQIAGLGDANRIADEGGLSLLRVFGVNDLTPAALVHEGARGSDLTLVGIADPQSQGGGRAVTTMPAKLAGDDVSPPPPLGFSGAAALDSQGRMLGMVTLKTPVLAGANAALPQASNVTVAAIRRFLDAQYVTPATGRSGIDAAKASVVRVICVRR